MPESGPFTAGEQAAAAPSPDRSRQEHGGGEAAPTLSPRQRGAVMRQFRRLGLADDDWLAHRLAVASMLTYRPGLQSISELTNAQAGQLARVLAQQANGRELGAYITAQLLAADEIRPASTPGRS